MARLDELVAHWGYIAIALIVVLGNVGVPVPEETILALGGYLAWQGQLRFSLVVAVGILGAVLGDNLGFWLGHRHGARAIDRYAGQWLGRPDLVERTQRFVARRGMLAVFVARFVPGLRFIAGPLAGATGMPLRQFAVANVLGYVVSGQSVQGLPDGSFGYIWLPALAVIAVCSVLTAPLGAKAAHNLPVKKLKRVFASILYLLAAYMLWKGLQG